jgi:MFS family permease
MLSKKHKEKLNEKKIKLIGFISFLLGFAQALLVYVESSYFKLAIGSDNVGIFYFSAYVVALIGLLNMHKIIKKIGEATAFFLFFLLQIIFIAFLILVPPSMSGILLLMGYIVTSYLVIVVLDIILEAHSKDSKSGRIRGFHLMVINIGFLLGPFLSSRILENFDYTGLFLLALVINIGIFVVGLIGLRDGNTRFEGDLTVRDLVKKIFVNKHLMRIYWISFALEFFYALMVVYTPLYLLDLGFGWDKIGIVFTIMLLPFVMFGYPAGLIADKKIGEKEMIIFGLLLMSISTLSIFFIHSSSLWPWAAILFVTRMGATLVETLRDSYFYKRIDGSDMDLISFFRTSRSTAYMIATAFSAIILVFFPIKAIFIFIALAMLVAIYPAIKLEDNKSEAEKKRKKH